MPRKTPEAKSPHGLLQEVFRVNPWLLLEASVLLNRTRSASLRAPLEAVHRRWPDPVDLAAADPVELAEALQPLGLQHRRAKALIDLAHRWFDFMRTSRTPPTAAQIASWPGVGPYVLDSYRIFIDGTIDDDAPRSGDAKLKSYCHWARTGEFIPIEAKRSGPKPRQKSADIALKLFDALRGWKAPRPDGTVSDATAADVRKVLASVLSGGLPGAF